MTDHTPQPADITEQALAGHVVFPPDWEEQVANTAHAKDRQAALRSLLDGWRTPVEAETAAPPIDEPHPLHHLTCGRCDVTAAYCPCDVPILTPEGWCEVREWNERLGLHVYTPHVDSTGTGGIARSQAEAHQGDRGGPGEGT